MKKKKNQIDDLFDGSVELQESSLDTMLLLRP